MKDWIENAYEIIIINKILEEFTFHNGAVHTYSEIQPI